MTIDANSVAAAERLADSEEQALRAGARAGLLGEGKPRGFERWPSKSQAEYLDGYATGRHCRRVAEGKERVAAAEPSPPVHATTRERLVDEFSRRADLQREFSSADTFVAFVMAERAGKARRFTGRVIR
jgi:hypothetical protein